MCCVRLYICVHTRVHSLCMRMLHALMDVFRFEKLCGCAQVSTRRLCILQMQIRKHLLESYLPSIPTYSCLPNTLQLNSNCNVKMPTGFYLCQSILYGLGANHDAPFCHWHDLPSKGCITDRQSLEHYVIGKAHWTVYASSLGAHSRDDIIKKCFSHQILSYHPLSATPSSSQVEL